MKFYNLSFHVVPLTLLQKWPKVMQTWIVLGLVFSISCTCMTNILYAYFVTAPNQEFLAISNSPSPCFLHFKQHIWYHYHDMLLIFDYYDAFEVELYSDILWFRYEGHSSSTQCGIGPEKYRECSVDLSYLVRTFSNSSPLTLQYTEYFFKYSSW